MRFSIPRNGIPRVEGASWIRAEGEGLPHPLLIRLGVSEDNRLVATGLLIEAEGELTTRELRLPLAHIVAEFAAAASKPATYKRLYAEMFGRKDLDKDPNWRAWRPEAPEGFPLWWPAADFVAVSELTRPLPRHLRPGRRGHPDEHYQRIARAYVRAKRKYPRDPVRKLMEATGKSEATVHRWIKTARDKGFLDTTKED